MRVVRLIASGCAVFVAIATVPVHAERLPLATYTVAHGLSGNDVTAALEHDQGFLWFGAERGVSRFDGREFRTFGQDHGLSDARVVSLARTRDGALWVGVWGGVYRLDVAGARVFTPVPVEGQTRRWERVSLAVDREGQLWCGADGLYKLISSTERPAVLRLEPTGRMHNDAGQYAN